MKNFLYLLPLVFLLLFSNTLQAQESADMAQDHTISQQTFTGSFNMIVTSYKNNKLDKHSPVKMEMQVKPGFCAITTNLPKGPTSLAIIDYDTNKILVVADLNGAKQGFKMNIPKSAIDQKLGKEDIKVVKTGATKTIDGYFCEEYQITTEDGVTNSWVTKDIDITWEDFAYSLQAFGGKNKKTNYSGMEGFEGFAVESIYVTSNGKEKTVIKMENINIGKVDESIFDTNGYNIMTMPSFGNN